MNSALRFSGFSIDGLKRGAVVTALVNPLDFTCGFVITLDLALGSFHTAFSYLKKYKVICYFIDAVICPYYAWKSRAYNLASVAMDRKAQLDQRWRLHRAITDSSTSEVLLSITGK